MSRREQRNLYGTAHRILMNGIKMTPRAAEASSMPTYEVHISPEPGVVVPHRVVHAGPLSLRGEGSLFFSTTDRATAEHCVEVIDATSRRSDDTRPWIREVP